MNEPTREEPGPSECAIDPVALPSTAVPFVRPVRGDVIWVYLDGALGAETNSIGKPKGRPAVVVQNDRGNQSSPTTIVALMTDISARRNYPEHVVVWATELGDGGKDSVVGCGSLRAIDLKYRMNQQIGIWAHLCELKMRQIDTALRSSLQLQ